MSTTFKERIESLESMGFYDFAGSTLLHSIGGWGALIAGGLVVASVIKATNGFCHYKTFQAR